MPLLSNATRARLFHVADLAAGHARGNGCPNCRARHATRLLKKHGGLGSIYRCETCGLLFRPTGLQTGRIAHWYYSALYGDDAALTTAAIDDRDTAIAKARAGGKDRGPLLAPLLAALPPEAQSIGVFGASWGYELLTLADLGLPVWGIEPGDARRERGRRAFGLELHASVAAARRAGRVGGVILSSHVLEHIPTLTAALDEVLTVLRPAAQLHLTPRVDPFTPAVGPAIGREHPLGVTAEFWRRFAAARHLDLHLAAHQPPSEPTPCELLALTAPAAAGLDLAALDFPAGAVHPL